MKEENETLKEENTKLKEEGVKASSQHACEKAGIEVALNGVMKLLKK
jgi:hypothetical protein